MVDTIMDFLYLLWRASIFGCLLLGIIMCVYGYWESGIFLIILNFAMRISEWMFFD